MSSVLFCRPLVSESVAFLGDRKWLASAFYSLAGASWVQGGSLSEFPPPRWQRFAPAAHEAGGGARGAPAVVFARRRGGRGRWGMPPPRGEFRFRTAAGSWSFMTFPASPLVLYPASRLQRRRGLERG